MRNRIKALKRVEFARHFVLYGIIGTICAGFDYVVSVLLHDYLSVNGFLANTIGIHCGIILSFFLNSRYNFKITDKTVQRFLVFYSVGLFGLALSTLILFCGEQLNFTWRNVKLFSIVFVAIAQFLINKYVTFKKQGVNNG